MKVAILTQPLDTNYGALMQAYAVQKTIRDMGYEAITLNIDRKNYKTPWVRQFYLFFASLFYVVLGKLDKKQIFWPLNHNDKNNEIIKKMPLKYMTKVMQISPEIRTDEELKKYCYDQSFDAYVVGSDQVWRPKYCANLGWFFLNFLDPKQSVLRIAFSASFGTSEWEYSEEQADMCKPLAQLFDAISVRESSGVDLCKKLGVNAIQTVDPTMLLTPADYSIFTDLDKTIVPSFKNRVFTYILDPNKKKDEIINTVSKYLALPVVEMTAYYKLPSPYSSVKDAIKNAPAPVSQWIKGFQESSFVITDSFHGTVFSILYHKPFIVIGNKKRGLARVETLLKTFGLESRLMEYYNSNIIDASINWNHVDIILKNKRLELIDYLTKAFKQ